jgi:transcriptional regulator with XRE-family HTH domain
MKKLSKYEKATVLVSRLLELEAADEGLKRRAVSILDRFKLPMNEVLAKMPGDSVSEKCRTLGISRQTYYAWIRGASRPNTKLAKKLAEWTDLDWQAIQGTRLSPPRTSAPLVAAEAV